MSTLKDVSGTLSANEALTHLLGASSDFMQEYGRRVRALGDAICEEAGVQRGEEATALSHDTALGSKSERLFTELREWLAAQSEHF